MKHNPILSPALLVLIALFTASCHYTPALFRQDFSADYSTQPHNSHRPVLIACQSSPDSVTAWLCIFTETLKPDSTTPGGVAWKFVATFNRWNSENDIISRPVTLNREVKLLTPFIPDTVWLKFSIPSSGANNDILTATFRDQTSGVSLGTWSAICPAGFPLLFTTDGNPTTDPFLKEIGKINTSGLSIETCHNCLLQIPAPPFETPKKENDEEPGWRSGQSGDGADQRTGLLRITNRATGQSCYIVKVNHLFPKPAKPGEGLLSIRYITTRSEFQQLINENDFARSFPSLWINTGSEQEQAEARARLFLEKVAETNLFFTCSRVGSLTDRGMVWIVFGKPDRVWKSPEAETWFYDNTDDGQPQQFEFKLQNTVYGAKEWILQRDTRYKIRWDRAIDRWRR